MVTFTATIEQFAKQGEKTGWSYVSIPPEMAEALKPGCRRSFRVKGKIDEHVIAQQSLLPMGNGFFILTINATIRRAIHKSKGAMVKCTIEEDRKPLKVFRELQVCLEDSPAAKKKFYDMLPSHQMYYSKWIESGKTDQTRAKRIMATILGMERNLTFAEVLKLNAQSVNK